MIRALVLAALLAGPAAAGGIVSSVDIAALSKSQATPLGLYLLPKDAHAALEADPSIVFVDVRDPVEVSFVGHAAPMDANVPLAVATRAFNPKSGAYKMEPNKGFVAAVDALMAREGKGKADPVFLICRSGSRSARGVEMLAAAGYTNVWNLVEGFEGDADEKTGARSLNGWRNAGLPWGYKLSEAQAWSPAAE